MANETRNFILGTVIGSVVGATVALLLAPKSGKDLRDDVGSQVENLKDKSMELASTAKEKSTNLKQYVSEQSEEIANKVKHLKKGKEEEIHDSWQEDLEEEEPLPAVDEDNRKMIPIE
ncbi:YtxH domain-containing protein [Massilibacterium senegalense]|uniref:YtxH domain-containing protein n=1 Tax=Massilibacterium senegalense TaxID=1632858 RepID=UPI000781637D|nr:YtxH domain-containing protein [Massilibacterium senegalense]